MRKPYPSDLTDDQWAIIEPLIPVNTVGRPREVDMREVLNAIFYLNRSGCQWDMLPHDLPAKSTVYDYFAQWRDDGTWQRIMDALRQAGPGGRRPGAAARAPAASTARRSRGPRSAASGATTGARRSAGVKRHIVVDTLGLLLVVVVTAASADDGTFAPEVLGRLTAEHRSRLELVWADSEVPQPLAWTRWLEESGGAGTGSRWSSRPPGSEGFVKLPQALGGGADVRLAGPVPAEQPGLRVVHAQRARR